MTNPPPCDWPSDWPKKFAEESLAFLRGWRWHEKGASFDALKNRSHKKEKERGWLAREQWVREVGGMPAKGRHPFE